jgi:hypothetical protein
VERPLHERNTKENDPKYIYNNNLSYTLVPFLFCVARSPFLDPLTLAPRFFFVYVKNPHTEHFGSLFARPPLWLAVVRQSLARILAVRGIRFWLA